MERGLGAWHPHLFAANKCECLCTAPIASLERPIHLPLHNSRLLAVALVGLDLDDDISHVGAA